VSNKKIKNILINALQEKNVDTGLDEATDTPQNIISAKGKLGDNVKEIIGESNKDSKKGSKKGVPPVTTLSGFLERFIENKGKVLAQDKKEFDRLDRDFSDENQVRLVNFFLEKDVDLKHCLALADFLLEGSKSSSIRLQTFDFIERVVSNYSLFESIKTNYILQAWLQVSKDGSDKLHFFEGQFRQLNAIDAKGKKQHFTDAQVATLLCISAVWLYFKGEAGFFTLTRHLSNSAFSTQGKTNSFVEPQAFSFATSMVSSNKRKGFGFFLQVVSETERSLSQQLKTTALETAEKASKILELTRVSNNLASKNEELTSKIDSLNDRIKLMETEISGQQDKARHRDTHHEDSKDELRIKLRNVLDGELKDVLEKAKKAHEKGKHEIVNYQIDDALEILSRELKRVESDV
jgi:hypothetical protein